MDMPGVQMMNREYEKYDDFIAAAFDLVDAIKKYGGKTSEESNLEYLQDPSVELRMEINGEYDAFAEVKRRFLEYGEPTDEKDDELSSQKG